MDPIGDMLTVIRNGSKVGKVSVVVPFSKIKLAILQSLEKISFIKSVTKKTKEKLPILEIGLAYVDKLPKIHEIKLISKPSRRVYLSVKEIKPVKNGRGEIILSTPKGILTGEAAKKMKVGGEALFEIW